MTNKPMLSAGLRKALADFIEYSVPGPRSDDAMWYADKQALRALLDKPNSWPCWSCKQPVSMRERADADGECPHCAVELDIEDWPFPSKQAAQHQGEPVGYVSPAGLAGAKSGKTAMFRSCVVGVYTIPLYAEQPAPVAVDAEILERFPEINFANYGQDEVEALQAWAFEAYEVIARLNGVKPELDTCRTMVELFPDSACGYYNGCPLSALSDPMQCWRDGYEIAKKRAIAAGLKVKS